MGRMELDLGRGGRGGDGRDQTEHVTSIRVDSGGSGRKLQQSWPLPEGSTRYPKTQRKTKNKNNPWLLQLVNTEKHVTDSKLKGSKGIYTAVSFTPTGRHDIPGKQPSWRSSTSQPLSRCHKRGDASSLNSASLLSWPHSRDTHWWFYMLCLWSSSCRPRREEGAGKSLRKLWATWIFSWAAAKDPFTFSKVQCTLVCSVIFFFFFHWKGDIWSFPCQGW